MTDLPKFQETPAVGLINSAGASNSEFFYMYNVSVVYLVFLHRLLFLGEKLPLRLLINVRGRRSAERGAGGGQNVNCRLDVHPAEK